MKISILYRYNNHMMIHVEKTHIVMNYQYIFLDKQLVLTKNFMITYLNKINLMILI